MAGQIVLGQISTDIGTNLYLTPNGSVIANTPIIGTSSITANNGVYSSNNFTGAYADGIVMDYVTGNGRVSVGTADNITFYNGGPAGTQLAALDTVGNLSVTGSVNSVNTFGFKNRIINGAMVISQRGSSFTPADGDYTLDRYLVKVSQSSKLTVAQSTTAPLGFSNSFKVTSSAATTVGTSDYFAVGQYIEGFNVADLNWGSVNAKTVTLSFQVYSSLTGTFGGVLQNSTRDRGYPFTYTISSANTWTSISVTIAGDTSGTWVNDSGLGIRVVWGLGVGSTYTASATGAWQATGVLLSASGCVNVVSTNGATWYITGVQLEKGSTATSFDYRPYGTELALCQRYLPAFNQYNSSDSGAIGMGVYYDTTHTATFVAFSVPARIPPTGVTVTNASGFANDGVTSIATTAIALSSTSIYGSGINVTVGSAATTGQGARLRFNGGATLCQLLFTGCEL